MILHFPGGAGNGSGDGVKIFVLLQDHARGKENLCVKNIHGVQPFNQACRDPPVVPGLDEMLRHKLERLQESQEIRIVILRLKGLQWPGGIRKMIAAGKFLQVGRQHRTLQVNVDLRLRHPQEPIACKFLWHSHFLLI